MSSNTNKIVAKVASGLSGTFSGAYGLDLILERDLIEGVLGSGDLTAVIGITLVGVGGYTVYRTADKFLN